MRSTARHIAGTLGVTALTLLLSTGCGGGSGEPSGAGGAGGHVGTGSSGGGASATGGGASGTLTGATGATGTASTGSGPMVMTACQSHIYQCGDLIDNDGDGLIDSDDPDCLGPCDNTEGGYYGGIPGQAGPACTVDCYFDQDSGAGNDDCHWSHKCDPHEKAPGYYPESNVGSKCGYDPAANTPDTSHTCDELYATQSQTCHDFCGPLTPNGCDCFGCCELPAGGGNYVWLGSEDANGNGSCSIADVGDPTKCQPCLPVAACLNTCGKCELCIGKTTLPPECTQTSTSSSTGTSTGTSTGSGAGGGSATTGTGGTGSGGEQCPSGVTPCGLPGQAVCPVNSYCITGCCQVVPG